MSVCSSRHSLSSRLALILLASLMPWLQAEASVLLAFPQAELEEERDRSSSSYRVMLSPIREVGSELRAENSVRLAVEGSGQLFRMAPGITRQDARRWYLEQLQNRGASILFQCSGRECGRSNVWANQVFDLATLYGRDAQQDYLVAGFEDGEGGRWLVVLYTVTRGNQREYLWLEQLQLADDAVLPGLDGEGGRLAGPVIVPWEGSISVSFEWGAESQRILDSMASDPNARIVIAGFSGLEPGETLEAATERAERAANTMSDLLDRSGLSRSRHIVRAIGPLVRFSTPERPENRIEILVIRPPEGSSGNE
ncbi:DUF4892 domain-containing protein [Marinobacter sp. AN1]|uniref:DUF4892 domain-containing protein n=1 Tax=Marinobacter sp. AN1 TaxID=2886046 RepID=UPI0022314F03|nr:DUF4892 domain-containing protein [Marinobacter sp. AN1]UZD67519.1 DUF4892 domain-containing protein [Marinobacter sp. AN1]